MGEKVPGGNSAREAKCGQRGAQEHALCPEGNGEPWGVADQTVTRSQMVTWEDELGQEGCSGWDGPGG